ncbi:MAG: DMT family transporter [Gammaproteobacteria bacterium]|nr:DMT family transporter [Gammaproteobacteria bacterium]MDH3431378.1 DMT family transporter [Gammaproteobacteria bacterium]
MSVSANPRVRLFAGAALISLSPVWVKLVDVSATTSGFYRVFIGGAALALYLLVRGQRPRFTTRIWQLLVLAAVFFALDLWFWHRSIIFVGPGLSTLLANFQVFILMLAGVLVLRQRPTAIQMVAVPLALLGLALIVGFDWRSLPADYRLGVVYGLLTAVVYAGYLLTMRFIRKDVARGLPTREIAVVSIVAAAILGASALLEGQSLAVESPGDFGWLVAYGVLSHCLGYILIVSSLPQVSTTEAGLALLLQPTLSFVWDVLFFARPMSLTELAGAAIALFAIYLGSRHTSKQV